MRPPTNGQQQTQEQGKAHRLRGGGAGKVCRAHPRRDISWTSSYTAFRTASWRYSVASSAAVMLFLPLYSTLSYFCLQECCEGCCDCIGDIICRCPALVVFAWLSSDPEQVARARCSARHVCHCTSESCNMYTWTMILVACSARQGRT